ncbi:hypothetical protein, partial [Aliiglaciecola sp. NS0011-25]|uniref:hypothetical protein n=1 Tax=Aliiglaciecola sp. NS0011-25 TaxID=3127654 RepID=UPI00333E3E5E
MSKIKNTYISERRCPRCNGQERYIKWKNCCHCQKENQKRNYAKNRKENNRIKNNEAFERAKLLGNKRFKSLDKCKKCGSVERYIKNRACVKCLMDKIVAERQFMKEV